MPTQVTISDADLARTINRLRALRGEITKRQFQSALRPGAKIIRDAAKANVPIAGEPYEDRAGNKIAPGFVRDAIEVKSLRRSDALFVGVVKRDGLLPYWAQWLEFGARNRDGSTRPGFGFMRRAVAEKKGEAVAAIVKAGERLISKIIARIQAR